MLYSEGKPTDLTYLYVNPAFHRLTGLGPVVGKRISEIIPGIQEATPEIFEIYGRVAGGGPSESFEIYVAPLDRWLSIEVSSPKPDHFVAVFTDISRRIEADQALRDSDQRYRTVVEDQTELISRFLADGTLIFVNEVYARFFAQAATQIVGRKWHPKAHPDDIPLIEAKLRALSSDNPVVEIENRVYSGQGEPRWMQFVNRAFFDANQQLIEIQSVGRDITERKEFERAINRAN